VVKPACLPEPTRAELEPRCWQGGLGVVWPRFSFEPRILGRTPLAAADLSDLSDGWYLIFAKGCDHAIVSDAILRIASAAGTAVACSMEEHVNFASAALWKDGVKLWAVRHQGDVALADLQVSGTPPEELGELKRAALAKQETEDTDWLCEVPVELSRRLTGYTPDDDAPGHAAFEALVNVPGGAVETASRPWWRFW
jgi:hypothetical protein